MGVALSSIGPPRLSAVLLVRSLGLLVRKLHRPVRPGAGWPRSWWDRAPARAAKRRCAAEFVAEQPVFGRFLHQRRHGVAASYVGRQPVVGVGGIERGGLGISLHRLFKLAIDEQFASIQRKASPRGDGRSSAAAYFPGLGPVLEPEQRAGRRQVREPGGARAAAPSGWPVRWSRQRQRRALFAP